MQIEVARLAVTHTSAAFATMPCLTISWESGMQTIRVSFAAFWFHSAG